MLWKKKAKHEIEEYGCFGFLLLYELVSSRNNKIFNCCVIGKKSWETGEGYVKDTLRKKRAAC